MATYKVYKRFGGDCYAINKDGVAYGCLYHKTKEEIKQAIKLLNGVKQ